MLTEIKTQIFSYQICVVNRVSNVVITLNMDEILVQSLITLKVEVWQLYCCYNDLEKRKRRSKIPTWFAAPSRLKC